MILQVRTPSFGGDFRGGQVNLQLRMFESLTVDTLARIWHYMTLCIWLCIGSSMLFSLAASSRWAVSTGLCLRWLATIKVSGPVQPCSNHKISQSGWNTDPQLPIDQNWMRSSQFWHHAGSTQDTTPGTSTELLLSHGYAASTSLPRQTSGPREPQRSPQDTSTYQWCCPTSASSAEQRISWWNNDPHAGAPA